MAKGIKPKPPLSTTLCVVEGKKGPRFKYEGFLFDRIFAGAFESEVQSWAVPIALFRPTAKYVDERLESMVYAYWGSWFVAWYGGHDGSHRLSKKNSGEREPFDTHLDAKYYKSGDLVIITGHKDRITRSYLRERAER